MQRLVIEPSDLRLEVFGLLDQLIARQQQGLVGANGGQSAVRAYLRLQTVWLRGSRELLRVPLRIAQLAVLIDAAGEQVMKQPLLDLLQLGDDLLGPSNRLVERAEDLAIALGWTPSATNSYTFLTSPAQLRFGTTPSRRGEQAALVSFIKMAKVCQERRQRAYGAADAPACGALPPGKPDRPSL